jgi:hypothetical protein
MNLKKTLIFGLLLSAGCALSAATYAQDMDQVLKTLDDALPGSLLHNPLDLEWDPNGNDLRTKIVAAEALPSGQAISAKLKKRQLRPWDSNIRVEIEKGVKKGETVEVHYWARTKKPAAGKETGNMILFVGRNEEPFDSIISEDVLPGTEWKLLTSRGVAKADFKANTVKAEYQLGRSSQTIEFGPIYVSNLGPQSP